ncbi:MAG: Uma2 family endonuclease [Bernardetiaceae bacterium]|nr:Uma2 family endonuclease [Bernardetiaceae bacterium]
MAAQVQTTTYTFEEYLALERRQNLRYAYWHGEVLAMAGGTKRHNRLVGNIRRTLEDAQDKNSACEVYAENVKLELEADEIYVYPDVMLTCDKADTEASDLETMIRKPNLIVEVLSPHTEKYDREEKKHLYFKIPTLQYYITLRQDRPFVEVYERQDDFWILRFYENKNDLLKLPKIQLQIRVADIYANVHFED